ncbi:PAS domain-containing protein [Robbsia sp. Bb-Pol-6]|uniref:histidine kinase n=1 Tax=Robbsia betulipollinis TaxID=2981849 RepID=A0ABT3ZQL2_9BURK|nr:PAS domain-containing protein [Robbsia betulipollinis]MCY0388826.1 PAS domain-containing protein [Robbsia betulipollinis]
MESFTPVGAALNRWVIDSATDFAMIATDNDGRVTVWSKGAEHILGWSEEEMLDQTVERIFTPEDCAAGRPAREMQLALTDNAGNDERWHNRKGGQRFWASGKMTPLRTGEGEVVGFVKVLRDRTERRLAAERGRADAAFLRSVLGASGDCIKVLDLEGNLLFMTDAGQALMQVSDFNAICGCPWPSFWQGRGHAEALQAIDAARAGGVGHFVGPAETMAGEPRWWDVLVTPILGPDGHPERLLSVSRDITREYETRERIELALDAGTVLGTWVWSIVPDRFIADSRFATTFALDPERLKAGLPLAEVVQSIHPDDARRVEGAIAAALRDGGRYCVEYRVRQLDGSWWWVEANGYCELDPSGQAVRFPGALFDIQRRKMQELRQAALIEFGDTLRALHGESGPSRMVHAAAEMLGRHLNVRRAGYGEIDQANGIVDVERDWCADPTVVSLAGRHRLQDYGTYGAVLARGEIVSIGNVETDWRTREGVERLTGLGIRSLLNVPLMQEDRLEAMLYLNDSVERAWADDDIAFAQAVADRTWAARRQAFAEIELRQANETLEARVEERTRERDRSWRLSRELLLIARPDGTMEAVNPLWTALLGYAPGELLGSSFVDYTHPDDLEAAQAAFASAFDKPLAHPHACRFRHKDGSYRWFSWTAAFEDGKVYASGRDIALEREQAEALRQSQKMEAVGQLTGGIAHDFNNLLTAVTGGLALLGARIAKGDYDKLDRYIDMAQTGAHRAAALTQRLLAFSRRQTLAPTPTDADRLIAGMRAIIDRTLGPAIEVKVAATAGLWPVLVDAPQLESALLNLCINARDAMPEGGRLTIETGNRRLDARAAADQDLPEGEYVSLCVTDTGAGMTPAIIERVFDPFFTTKPIGQGTGLGLSMIYGFVRQSGGQVRVYSEVGQGTTMGLYLPRHLGDVARIDDAGRHVESQRALPGETVLIVEDESAIRQLVAEVLTDAGYRVLKALNGPIGVKLMQSNERIDLLITDVGLPGGLNGRQVADAGRAVRPGLKVLFVTGYAASAAVGAGHLDEGMELLTKPFNVADLEARVHRMIKA